MLSLGCAPLSEKTLIPGSQEDLLGCFTIFPAGPWESVHKIEATIQGGVFSTLLGVTRGEPLARRLHSLLLTSEGFILFEAELRGGEIIVRKAVPPFDSPAFARGLMDDVAFLFLPPAVALRAWGKEGDGTQVCRWESSDGLSTEVRGGMDRSWRILRRDGRGEVIKEIRLKGPFLQGLASEMEIQVYKPASYKLAMTLLSSAP
jgi:hypothetical protein